MNKNRILWLSGTISALLFIAMLIYTSPLQPSIPCLQLTYDETAFRTIFDQWKKNGIDDIFRKHFYIDFPVLISYGLFGYLLASRTSLFAALPAVVRRILIRTLPLAASLDAGENLLHLYLTSGAGQMPPSLYLTAGLVATGKWLLIALFLAAAGHAGLQYLRARQPR